ncbi:glutamine synthetase family protein [Rhizobium sp. C4]|uniref:glutamine synthetase family protein n=1 Tax=Rhizobium sp. C4 TaxID=1349800 RepID=UPI001E286358|nr:glutamine synthetase family protein [Rhizobium sp. C4]MCD2174841.1 glutamine synthetase family protein [Rhizobium sp. C4]
MRKIEAPARPTAPDLRASAEELQDFLNAHPEIEAFDLMLVDPNGIARGKIVRRHEIEGIWENGRNLPGSILGLDVTGEDVDETGLVWSDGDADRCAWPIAGSLSPSLWTDPPRGQFRVALHEMDGRPVWADPRHVLQRQIDALAGRGLSAIAAFELEFYLIDAERPSLDPEPARLPLTGRRPFGTNVYCVEELDRLEPFSRDLYRAAEAQGLPVETLISEYAPGQFELTLHHGEVMRAAENLLALKHLLRGVARRHGMQACFMAKPFADRAGSGMHLHASLCDSQGRNLFADRNGALSPDLLAAIGGLLDTVSESMLVMAPHNNSWRRFSAQSYAPTTPNWGINNRGVAVRVPAGSPGGRHLEQRLAGVDANPFLVAAVTLAAMVKGLDGQRDPGAPAEGNGSAPGDAPALPRTWAQAIEAAEASAFLKEVLGETMHRVFLAIKRAEAARFDAYVSPLDYQLYLDTV